MTKLFLALVVGVLANLVSATAKADLVSSVVADSPVAYFRLSETSGTSVSSSVGSLTGVVGSDVGLNASGPSFVGFGPSNSAASFIGTTTGSFIDVGTSLSTSLSGSGAISLELWASNIATAGTKVGAFVGLLQGNGTSTTGANITFDALGRVRIGGRSSLGDGFQAGSNVSLTGLTNSPIHVVGVLDFANKQILTYVNGELKDTVSGRVWGSTSFTPGAGRSVIGGVANGLTDYASNFNGTLDEVAFYNTGLTSAQVLTHYNAAFSPTAVPEPSSLVLFGIEGAAVAWGRKRKPLVRSR